jgi:ABC-type multidrug transport system permease subunit
MLTSERWYFVATVIVVIAFLGTGVYLKVNGYGEWNWLFLALAILTPFFFGIGFVNRRHGSEQEEDLEK